MSEGIQSQGVLPPQVAGEMAGEGVRYPQMAGKLAGEGGQQQRKWARQMPRCRQVFWLQPVPSYMYTEDSGSTYSSLEYHTGIGQHIKMEFSRKS